MKTIDQNTINAAKANGSYPIELLSIELDGGENLYLNTGYRTITYNGNEYTSGSGVLGFSAVEETLDTKTNSVTIELNGVPAAPMAGVINDLEKVGVKPIGGKVTIYQAFMDQSTDNVILNTNIIPGQAIYQKWQGIIYSFSTTEENQSEGNIKVNIECKNILVAILDSKAGRFTSKTSFQQINENDLSMEFVADIVNFNPNFGSEE